VGEVFSRAGKKFATMRGTLFQSMGMKNLANIFPVTTMAISIFRAA
jgi:hypothetical protein